MSKKTNRDKKHTSEFADQIDVKAKRKMKAKHFTVSPVWFGLGMMGLVGWSVVVPTLLGAALGQWLDKNIDDGHSWTLALLVAGLVLGCFNAWFWIAKEEHAMHDQQEGSDE